MVFVFPQVGVPRSKLSQKIKMEQSVITVEEKGIPGYHVCETCRRQRIHPLNFYRVKRYLETPDEK